MRLIECEEGLCHLEPKKGEVNTQVGSGRMALLNQEPESVIKIGPKGQIMLGFKKNRKSKPKKVGSGSKVSEGRVTKSKNNSKSQNIKSKTAKTKASCKKTSKK